MEDYSRDEHEKAGYDFVFTPHLSKSTLFEISGHLGWYADGMYPPMEMEGATYYPKPMNCPMHILIYKSQARSYRELPLRLFELGTVYRFERSGVLHGLTRVRGITQDDSHIFVAPDQLAGELTSLLAFVLRILATFGLTDFEAELATRPEKFVGEPEEWEVATAALREALEGVGIPYQLAEGEGAFYAPKIDVHVKDAIGRRWQISTLQVDLQMPQRFDMEFVGADNQRHRPFMIHRALFGSVERFFGILARALCGRPAGLAVAGAGPGARRARRPPGLRRLGGREAEGGRTAGRHHGGRRAPRRAHPAGQAGEAALHPGGGRRRRGRRHRRGQPPGRRGGAGRGRRRVPIPPGRRGRHQVVIPDA